jgi:hypothetical protein
MQGLLRPLLDFLKAWAAEITTPLASRPNHTAAAIDEASEFAVAAAVPELAKQLEILDSDTHASVALLRETLKRMDLVIGSLPTRPSSSCAASGSRMSPASVAVANAVGVATSAEGRRALKVELQRRRIQDEEQARQAQEVACAAARGAPPPPRSGWRTPAERLPDLLALWDFLGTFATALWLPPIPLVRLDAALNPDPAVATGADAASGLVLRDIHCALLRTVEGRAGKGAPRPKGPLHMASLTNIVPCVGDHHWQVRLVKVLEARIFEPLLTHEPHALEAMERLRRADYLCLPLEQRFAILNVLMLLALQSSILRHEFPFYSRVVP